MLNVLFLLFIQVKKLYSDIKETSLECSNSNPCVFTIGADSKNNVTFLNLFNLESADEVRYSYTKYTSLSDISTWNIASDEEKNKVWKSMSSLSVYVKPASTKDINVRGGKIRNSICPSGTIISTKESFNIQDYSSNPIGQPPSQFCLIFLHQKASVVVKNTLNRNDQLTYRVGYNDYRRIGWQRSKTINSDRIPIYLIFKLSNNNEIRKFTINLNNVQPQGHEEAEYNSKDIPTLDSIDESEEEGNENGETEESSSDIIDEPPDEIEESSSSISSSSELVSQISITPLQTPEETWEGDWDDPPMLLLEVMMFQRFMKPIHQFKLNTLKLLFQKSLHISM